MFSLKILSPKGNIYIGEVDLANVPTTNGTLGIMSYHENLVSSLKLGVIEIMTHGQRQIIICNGGLLKASNNIVELFVVEAVMTSELVLETIKQAEVRASQEIQKTDITTSDLIRLEKQLKFERFKREYLETRGI